MFKQRPSASPRCEHAIYAHAHAAWAPSLTAQLNLPCDVRATRASVRTKGTPSARRSVYRSRILRVSTRRLRRPAPRIQAASRAIARLTDSPLPGRRGQRRGVSDRWTHGQAHVLLLQVPGGREGGRRGSRDEASCAQPQSVSTSNRKPYRHRPPSEYRIQAHHLRQGGSH